MLTKHWNKEIDGIVESLVLTNSMIDAIDPNGDEGLDLITELVGNIKVSDSQLINILFKIILKIIIIISSSKD